MAMNQVVNYSKKLTVEMREHPLELRDYLVCTYYDDMKNRCSIRPAEDYLSERNIQNNTTILLNQFPSLKQKEAQEICQHRISHKLRKLHSQELAMMLKNVQKLFKLTSASFVIHEPVTSQWGDELAVSPFYYSQKCELPGVEPIPLQETEQTASKLDKHNENQIQTQCETQHKTQHTNSDINLFVLAAAEKSKADQTQKTDDQI